MNSWRLPVVQPAPPSFGSLKVGIARENASRILNAWMHVKLVAHGPLLIAFKGNARLPREWELQAIALVPGTGQLRFATGPCPLPSTAYD